MAVRHEVHERLRQVIETLSDRDREIILLRGIGQKSNVDVAAELGVQSGTVAVRYHRALNRLRTLLPASAFDDLFAEDALTE